MPPFKIQVEAFFIPVWSYFGICETAGHEIGEIGYVNSRIRLFDTVDLFTIFRTLPGGSLPLPLPPPGRYEPINLEWLVATLSNLTRQIVELIAFTLKLNKLGSRFGCFGFAFELATFHLSPTLAVAF